MLVCAPTGAGKTNVAMLTILHEIGLHRCGTEGCSLHACAASWKCIHPHTAVDVQPLPVLLSDICSNRVNPARGLAPACPTHGTLQA